MPNQHSAGRPSIVHVELELMATGLRASLAAVEAILGHVQNPIVDRTTPEKQRCWVLGSFKSELQLFLSRPTVA